jgi:hypothetical protein
MVRGNIRHAWGVALVSLMLLAGSPVVRAAEFAGGTGEPNDPYLIATIGQFDRADFDRAGLYHRLCSDLDFRGTGIVIARFGPFRSHLDGAGHRIQHVTIASPEGLFDTIEPGATVTNLVLEDAGLSTQGYEFAWCVGMLAAANYGTISNCRVSGWLAVPRAEAVGGLVGDNAGLIINCCFDGLVAANWMAMEFDPPQVHYWVGGLAGMNRGSINNCYATGTALAYRDVGGLVGLNSRWNDNPGSITDCYATMEVMTEFGGAGLVAANSGVLTRCYATGWVTGEMGGGLAGLASGNGGTVIGCLWDTFRTRCRTSAGGLGLDNTEMRMPWLYANNGWAGDLNWVINEDWMQQGWDYPRLSWEGVQGTPFPEPMQPWLVGSGTPEDPYQIASDTDLDWLCTASIFWDKHFVLVNDIPYGPSRTIGICRGSAFAGTFDGNGHTIHSMHLDNQDATARNLGVFGYVTGQIRNLTVENVYLASGPKSLWVGLLVGTCEGLIENCRVTGSVKVGANSKYIGELIGYVIWPGGEVVGCEADATIEAGEGSTDVGGLVGYWEPDPRPR